ncbi:MAG TPA: hypothetical protein VM183_11175 [Burkholderiales bacterium]|nr:hypothetical protein [Burkholderiales bacterium]
MLSWSLRFFVAAALVAVVAASDIASEATAVAKLVVAVLLALSTVSVIAALRRER